MYMVKAVYVRKKFFKKKEERVIVNYVKFSEQAAWLCQWHGNNKDCVKVSSVWVD